MRILQVSSSGALGGAERILLDLASGLRARGHDVALPERPVHLDPGTAFTLIRNTH